ncbi:MAG: DnaB-like helicase C-terminal domain-containing protein [Planctomycetota bacterium]
MESRVPVAIFSLEVDRRQLAMNLLCGEARVSTQKLRSADLSGREWEDIGAAAGVLSESPIFVDDSVGLNTMSIRAKARRLKARHDLGLVIVDYLQMLELGGRRPDDSRQQEISAISRALKNIARELEIPVITVSQLSRAVEQRESHRPRMSDLRESGAIEQDADLILLLYREEYYNPDKAEAKGKADVIIAKQRNGPTGSVELTFLGEWLRFENAARYEEEF